MLNHFQIYYQKYYFCKTVTKPLQFTNKLEKAVRVKNSLFHLFYTLKTIIVACFSRQDTDLTFSFFPLQYPSSEHVMV